MRVRLSPPLCALALSGSIALPLAASAVTIVSPGTGTLQAAIDAAAPGARLILTEGTYVGPVVVDKPLRITCVGQPCEIDANCEAAVALDIAADGVRVQSANPAGVLTVSGGTDTQMRIANHSKVELRTRINAETSFLTPCGTEQNGIEVSGTSSKVKLIDARAFFNPGAGLLLSGLTAGSKVQVSLFFALRNDVGIAVANSAVGSKLGKSGIVVRKSWLSDNAVGIQVAGSDGLLVKRVGISSDVMNNVGISLDASSNRALITRSDWHDDSGSGTSYVDAGTGTCGLNNVGFSIPICQ